MGTRYPAVRASRVRCFLEEKGYQTSGAGFLTFFGDRDSPEVDLDVESEWIDLTHLVQDRTTVGASELANELLVALGMHDY